MDLKDIIQNIDNLKIRVANAMRILDIENKRIKIKILEAESQDEGFWDNTVNAQNISKELAFLKEHVMFWDNLGYDLDNLREVAVDDVVSKDINLLDDIEKTYLKILENFEKEEFFVLFNNKYDNSNVILSIHAGAGGDDAQDFASMLLRMYLRFCDKKGFKATIIDETKGGEVGLKSVTVLIEGNYAYGYLRSEYGVHRVIRISPFDADHARHTSFVSVEILPELDDIKEIVLKDEDLRIDTFCSSGAGGQSVNTTYSAVRIVHIPTGISVSCQNERNQSQNKEIAMKILKSKLLELKQKELLDEKNQLKGDYKSIEWGSQARTYVFHPYKQVRYHRSEYETSNIEDVMNGNIEELIEAFLRKK
ncbi:MAG: peptide chain release factor 2 [Patescibacteria group bacterium]